MRLEQMEAFSAAAECGSISGAAQRLGISQPAVTASIKALENELGGRLVRRSNRGIGLTSFGWMTLRDVAKILATVRGMRERGADAGAGMVSICSQPQMSSHLTRQVVVPFHREHPQIEIFVRNASLSEVEDELKSGRSCMAIMLMAPGESISGMLKRLRARMVPLYTDVRRIFLGSGHPLAGKDEITVEDLATLDLAYYSRHSDMISSRYREYFRLEYRLAAREDILDLVMRGKAACIQCGKLLRNDYRVRRGLLVEKALPQGLNLSDEAPVAAICMPDLLQVEQELWEALISRFARGMG